jgi:hypothetical protein
VDGGANAPPVQAVLPFPFDLTGLNSVAAIVSLRLAKLRFEEGPHNTSADAYNRLCAERWSIGEGVRVTSAEVGAGPSVTGRSLSLVPLIEGFHSTSTAAVAVADDDDKQHPMERVELSSPRASESQPRGTELVAPQTRHSESSDGERDEASGHRGDESLTVDSRRPSSAFSDGKLEEHDALLSVSPPLDANEHNDGEHSSSQCSAGRTRRRKHHGFKRKREVQRVSNLSDRVKHIGIPGTTQSPSAQEALQTIARHHRKLTGDVWNSHSYSLAEHRVGEPIGVTNGEMVEGDMTALWSTLMDHGNMPTYARLGPAPEAGQSFLLDVGSGYGRAVLHAKVQTGVSVCAGIEVAKDRCFISHRLAEEVGLSGQVQFIAADFCDPVVRPVLLAATHLFAYSRAFSDATRRYLARALQDEESRWRVYITCDPPGVLQSCGVVVHADLHWPSCDLGGVHAIGKLRSMKMAVSGEQHTLYVYVRCQRPAALRAEHSMGELEALTRLSEETATEGRAALASTLTTTQRFTRARAAA